MLLSSLCFVRFSAYSKHKQAQPCFWRSIVDGVITWKRKKFIIFFASFERFVSAIGLGRTN